MIAIAAGTEIEFKGTTYTLLTDTHEDWASARRGNVKRPVIMSFYYMDDKLMARCGSRFGGVTIL